MAFKLSTKERNERSEIAGAISDAYDELQQAVEDFNNTLTEARSKVEDAVAEYNECVRNAQTFVEEIVSAAQEAFDDKSEKWQEGEAGESARAWIEAWDAVPGDLEEIEIDFPDDIECHDSNACDALNDAPEEKE